MLDPSMRTDTHAIGKMKCNEFGSFKLRSGTSHLVVGKWTKVPRPTFKGSSQHMYYKTSRCPGLERDAPESLSARGIRKDNVRKDIHADANRIEQKIPTPPVTVEEAEKLTEEMIQSYSKNNTMRQLLEDARYFAGAATLSGAVGVRRAKAQITRFEP